MSSGKKRKGRAVYTCLGIIPLENCVTAVTENLLVNLNPSKSSVSSSSTASIKKRDRSHQEEVEENKSILGATHLDAFLIHEVIFEGKDSNGPLSTPEFTTKSLNSLQLPSSLQNRTVVHRSKWVSLLPTSKPLTLLILCTNLAAYFYNELGTKQLFKFTWDGKGKVEEDSIGGACKAIASTKRKIILGNERGELYLFVYNPKEKKGGGISHLKNIKVSPEPVSELSARNSGLVVVGTLAGAVSVWTKFEVEDVDDYEWPHKSSEFVLSKPEPVTGIILWYPYAVVSYGSGMIRLFNLIEKVLSAQVFAHARWISSMDLCSESNLLLSISEDDEARIWSLKRRVKGEECSPIKLHSSIQIEDVNFIGGKFLNKTGTLIALANLGSKDLAVYSSEK